MGPLDVSGWIPDQLRRRIFDGIINNIAKQTDAILGKHAGNAVRKLSSDGEFISEFDTALKQTQKRFVSEYDSIDPELVKAISSDVSFWQADSVHQAIMTIIQKPGAWIDTERNSVLQHFEDVFPNRFSRSRVDNAVTYFLKCLSQELLHLPALQKVYEFQLQQYSAIQLTEVNREIKGLRSDFQQSMALPANEILQLKSGQQIKQLDSAHTSILDKLQPSLLGAPPSLLNFVGRSDILSLLDQFWNNSNTGVIGIIGWGGMGKSSIARRWIDTILSSIDSTCEGVFWWSFSFHTSVDEFVESILIYLGNDLLNMQYPISSVAKIQLLIRELMHKRIVIVLDGAEALQFDEPHRSNYGKFKSIDLLNILETFADKGKHISKIIITSRTPLIELGSYPAYRSIDVEALTASDGSELLLNLGVRGESQILNRIVETYGGHPLTLTLLAGYLVRYADGLASKVCDIPTPMTDTNRYEAVHKILEHYDEILTPIERALIMLISAFRSPIHHDDLDNILKQPGTSLTNKLIDLPLFDFIDLVNRLVNIKLIRYDGLGNSYTLHPLIQDFYRRSLAKSYDLKVETYLMLCKYSLALPMPREMDSLEKGSSKIDAVYYSCKAEDFNLAFNIWYHQVQQKRWAIQKQFGALELDIELIELFLPGGNWHEVPCVSGLKEQAILINQLGYVLNRLGRTEEALPLLLKAGTLRIAAEDWENAACSFFDISEAKTHLGDLSGSLSAAQHSIELARRGPLKRVYSAAASVAWVNFLMGQIDAAEEHYKICESLETTIESDRGSVYLADRVHRVTFLIRMGKDEQAITEIYQNLDMAKESKWSDEISSCIRQLGDIQAIHEDYINAVEYYSDALTKAKTVGRIDETVLCLLSRAKVLIEMQKWDDAENDINSASNICRINHWRLHEAEAIYIRARIYIKQKKFGTALTYTRQSLLLSKQISYKWIEADCLEQFGLILQKSGKIKRSQYYLNAALLIRNALRDPGSSRIKQLLDEISVE